MKKSLLGLLLAVALVVPAFAAKGDVSINGKLGLGLSNNFALCGAMEGGDDAFAGTKMNMPVSLGAEFFYGVAENLSVGAGVNYSFKSDSKDLGGAKCEIGATNIYVAVKPEAKLNSEIFTSIYLVGQLGLSMMSFDVKDAPISFSTDSGLYLGIGAGATIANQVLVELICSSATNSLSLLGESHDIEYTAVTLNVGYKFAL